METTTLEIWAEVKQAVADLEKDMQKNGVKHNCSAGVRVRHGVRDIGKLLKSLSKTSLESDKATKVSRSETPEAQARAAARKAKKEAAVPAA